ncbi:MAG: hypothetical protein ACYCX2_12015 [Christensenellales bacterium]
MATYQISAGADDGYVAAGVFYATGNLVGFGNYITDGVSEWLRFPNVAVPHGATITGANVQLRANNTLSGTTVNSKIYCNDEDDAAAPTNATEFENKALTTAYVDWNNVSAWTSGTWYDSPEIMTVIQEVIDRAGWASGNAIMIIHKNNGSTNNAFRAASSYEQGITYAAKLVLTYELNATVMAVVATSTSDAKIPAVAGECNPTVAAALATAVSDAKIPGIEGVCSPTVIAVSAASTSDVKTPMVEGVRNAIVAAVVAAAISDAKVPVVAGEGSSDNTYITAKGTFGYSSVNGNNTITKKIEYRKYGDVNWSMGQNNPADDTYYTFGGGAINPDYAYEVRFTVTDAVVGAVSSTLLVKAVFVTMHIKNGGKGIGFGAKATADEFQVHMPARFTEDITIDAGKTLNGYRIGNLVGHWFSVVPLVDASGVMEIGKYIDFHDANADTNDYSVRLYSESGTLKVAGNIDMLYNKFVGNGNLEKTTAHAANKDEEIRIGSYWQNNLIGIGFNYRINSVGGCSRHIVSHDGGVRTTHATVDSTSFAFHTLLCGWGGFEFAGGTNAIGRIFTDVNWGCFLRGRSGGAADIAFATSGGTVVQKITNDNNTWFYGNVSADSFTDRTPHYEGDALSEIMRISGIDGQIDHGTLPEFARKKIINKILKSEKIVDGKNIQTVEELEEDGRDLGAMVSMLTVAMQQLKNEIEALKNGH